MTDRRKLLQGALGGAAALAALSLPRFARVAFAAAEPRVTRVTDRIATLSGAGGSILALSTSGGQVLVDSGAPASADALLATLAGLPGGGRVRVLFNTHWHSDQVGANEALGRAGAKIIAHEKTRVRLATGYYLPAEDRYTKPLPDKALPAESFYTRGETLVDGERIEYGYLLEAHTDGDIYVYFRDSNVLAVGCAVSPTRDPVLDWFGGGWLGGRIDALKLLLEIGDERTQFVPAYGPAVGRTAVQAEHDLMRKLFERMADLVRKGYSPEDMLAAGAMDGLGRSFEDPLKFVYAADKGLWAHNKTLSPDIV